MIELLPCRDRIDELVRFAASLNSEAAHHIGFFGEGEVDVRASLAENLIPPAEGFLMAYEQARLIGVFGVDASPEIDRAWLFGPLIDHPDWHDVADRLYARLLPRIPPGIRDYDLFCDVHNTRMDAFALRHGFPLHSENAVLTLARDDYHPGAGRGLTVRAYRDEDFSRLESLHRDLFPNAYMTAREIVERIDERHALFLGVEADRLLGYHACKLEPDSGYIDFIGTDPAVRGRGAGADLLAAGLEWMFSAPETQKIALTVNTDNAPARHLYDAFGFVTARVMRGYRKRLA